MRTTKLMITILLCTLLCAPVMPAQDRPREAQANNPISQDVLIIIQPQQVRFSLQKAVQEARLQVFDQAGELSYDSGAAAEPELIWPLRGANGEALKSGLYAYALSLKDVGAETARVRRGHFIVDRAQDRDGQPDHLWVTSQSDNGVGTELTVARNEEGTVAGTSLPGERKNENAGDKTPGNGTDPGETKGREQTSKSPVVALANGTTGQIAKFTSATDLGNSVMAEQNGNIGVGTTSPQQRLHVDGNEILSTGGGAGFKFRNRGSASSADDWVWYSQGNVARFWRAGVDLLAVTPSGSVGIGTTNPLYKFHVAAIGDHAIYGQSDIGIGVWGNSSSNAGVYGATAATSLNATGVYGIATAGSGQVTGVLGAAKNSPNGTGVIGQGNLSGGIGVNGSGLWGVYGAGSGSNGIGVYGVGTGTGRGVSGYSSGSGIGTDGGSQQGYGVRGTSGGNAGVYGTTASTGFNVAGVLGEATASSGTVVGVYGKALNDSNGTGVAGFGRATGGYFSASGNAGTGVGVYGAGDSEGVHGQTPNGTGVIGAGKFGMSGFGHTGGFGGYFKNVDAAPGNNEIALFVEGIGRMNVLQITGGADFSENFDVNLPAISGAAARAKIEAGLVVSIDPTDPGKLQLSTQAYDRRVAGIISGAGGVKPGMMMSQAGTLADGQHPVALSGRVYCWVDAAQGAIEPGDLLTTSSTPGHAMKVTDPAKAQGAIIGKAMTSLKEGKGLVLVLVTLQ